MDLYQYLQEAQKSLFRFESLQEYKVDGDGIDDAEMKDWWDFIAQKTKNGVQMQRVRLVREPLTEYTKQELIIHAKSKTFGDDIKTISGTSYDRLAISQEDFWLIDEKIVLIMKYSESGEYVGFERKDMDIENYIAIKNTLIKHSETLQTSTLGKFMSDLLDIFTIFP